MFLDTQMQFPVFSQWYFNDVDAAPFPAGTTWGWQDPNGSVVTTTTDGATPGDGAGGVKTVAKGFHLSGTLGGHIDSMDDIAQLAKRVTPGGLTTWHNDVTGEIAHFGGMVNLGAVGANLTAANAVFAQTHISNYDSALQTAKLNDYITFANLLHTSGAVNSGQLATILAALVAGWTHTTTIPAGSSLVKAAT